MSLCKSCRKKDQLNTAHFLPFAKFANFDVDFKKWNLIVLGLVEWYVPIQGNRSELYVRQKEINDMGSQ